MRVAMMIRANRADYDGSRAFLGRDIRADKAGRAKCAIAAAVLRRFHVMTDKGNLAVQTSVGCSAQIVDCREVHNLRLNSGVASAAAIAERRNG